jgi:hypothetical protein
VCQIYVDDIIFGSTNKVWADEFSWIMKKGLRCPWWESWSSFLDFKLSNSRMARS